MPPPLTKTEITMKTLGVFSEHPFGTILSANELGVMLGKSRRYMDGILTELRDLGLVTSHRGTDGGYSLAREAHLITFLEPVLMVNESLGLTSCSRSLTSQLCPGCEAAGSCFLLQVFVEARMASEHVLRERTFARSPPH
jgi:Rrf2 family protein